MYRKRRMFRRAAAMLFCALLAGGTIAAAGPELTNAGARAGILVEAETGTVLWEKNADERLAPASITKVMTLLLAMEELERGGMTLDEKLTVSAAAASMGGSQAYMAAGETYTVEEVLKCIAVVSANDASVVMAERLAGSEAAFAEKMNARARELGMNDTCFCNCTGLPAEGHLTTARDVARMSRELMKHKKILDYSTIWMDSIREGSFTLSNTNKLLKTYPGANGLKTGSTTEAGCCLAATAERDGMTLAAVVLGAKTSNDRFASATALLDYGFAGFALCRDVPEWGYVPVDMGVETQVRPVLRETPAVVTEKSRKDAVTARVELAETVHAPVQAGQKLGEVIWSDGEQELYRAPLVAEAPVERLGFGQIYGKMLEILCCLSHSRQ